MSRAIGTDTLSGGRCLRFHIKRSAIHIQYTTTDFDTAEFCCTNKIAKVRSCTDSRRTECLDIERTAVDSNLSTLYVSTKTIR